MTFVILVRHTFQSYSHRFVGIDNTTILGLVFPNIAAGFTAATYWCFTKHCCWHRNFQLSTSVCHGVFKFFITRFNEEDTTFLLHYRVWVSRQPTFASLCFFAASDICFHISGHTVSGLEVVCFLVSLSPDHVYPSGGLSFNEMNLVKPVHASDNFSFSIHVPVIINIFSNNTSSDVRRCTSVEQEMILLSACTV